MAESSGCDPAKLGDGADNACQQRSAPVQKSSAISTAKVSEPTLPARINWPLILIIAFVVCFMIYLASGPHYPVPRGYITR
jgi:hypothetical protein